MSDVKYPIGRGQAHELASQIEKAINAAGKNPEAVVSDMLRTGFFRTQTEQFLGNNQPTESILRVTSSNEKLMLRPRDGSRTIRSSKNVFSHIDTDFKVYGADQKGGSTEEAEVVVHEMEKDANFVKMFASLNHDMDALCMTQDQILEFIEMHRRWLRTDCYATFFLFKSNDQFFVAYLYVIDGGTLEAYVRRLEDDYVWPAGDRRRVVVPQLTK